MTLEQILTEENKASILNEVERERRRILVTRMYEEGMNSDDQYVREGTAHALAALAQVDPIKFIELVEKGINDENDDVRKGTAGTLAALAFINPDKFVELYEKGINDVDGNVRYRTAKTLVVLDSINIDKFGELLDKGIMSEDAEVRDGTGEALCGTTSIPPNRLLEFIEKWINNDDRNVRYEYEIVETQGDLALINPNRLVRLREKGISEEEWHIRKGNEGMILVDLASINPDKFVELCEKGIINEDKNVRSGTAETLAALASINPDKFVELYVKGINDKDWDVRRGTAGTLAALASINPDKFVELYEKGINDEDENVRIKTSETLAALASINPDKFVELYEKGINDKRWYIKIGTAKTLAALASVNIDKFIELYKKGINDIDDNVIMGTVGTLAALAPINPNKFMELYQKGISDERDYIRNETAKTLVGLASTISQETLVPIRDKEYEFIVAYLSSKYTQHPDDTSRPKEDLQQELTNLVKTSEGLDYQRLQRLLDAGHAKDLDEMIECSKVNVKNYRVIKKGGEGAYKKVYLAESKKSSGYFVVLKQVNPSQFGIDSISQHYPSFKDWLNEELHITKLAKLKSSYVARPEAPIEGEDGNIYLVEEPFKETLREKLKREGKFSVEETLKIILQIAQGLKDAHNYAEGQIIHRDLKPSNIGLDKNGDVKLIDFGSLESMSRSPREGDLSNILYSAPEVLEGGKTTVKSNIYSVGVLLYEMLTGENLFVPRNEDGTLKHKPKEVGEERKGYKRDVLENIARISQIPLEERSKYIMKGIFKCLVKVISDKGILIKYNKPNNEIDTYVTLSRIIASCLAYNQKERLHPSIKALILDISIAEYRFENGSNNLTTVYTAPERKISGDSYIDRDFKLFINNPHKRMRERALTRLRCYKEIMDSNDYNCIEEALEIKKHDT